MLVGNLTFMYIILRVYQVRCFGDTLFRPLLYTIAKTEISSLFAVISYRIACVMPEPDVLVPLFFV